MNKRHELPVAIAIISLGLTACHAATAEPSLPSAAVSTVEQTATTKPAPASAPPRIGIRAYSLPAEWQTIYSTGFGSGASYVEAHYQTGSNSLGQKAVRFYVAKTYSGQPLPSFKNLPTPDMKFGCNDGYFSAIADGRFGNPIGPPDAAICKPGARPSMANLPQPAEMYAPRVSSVIFPALKAASD